MPPRSNVPDAKGAASELDVRSQLDQILASELFVKSERLTSFLRFVVERTLDGEAVSLKEQVLVSELYGRGPDFDTRADPVVRVDARRLRDKLREYYSEHPQDPVLISLPKGTYAPVFERNPTALSAAPEATSTRRSRPRHAFSLWIIGVAAALIALGIGAYWLSRPSSQTSFKLLPLTSYPGNESQASLSPDGNSVAYACTAPEPGAQSDICVKPVGSDVVQRLTETPDAEYWPAWSPDGMEILFGRGPGGSAPAHQAFGEEKGIFVISRMGGPERKISDTGAIAVWMPDGKSVLIRDRLKPGEPHGIFQVDMSTYEKRRLTQPTSGSGDWRFDVSPDGKTLAFIRVSRPGISDLYVMSISGGEPRRLTDLNKGLSGVAWMPDGKELIYAVDNRLWRIAATLPQPGRGSPVADIPMQVIGVSISRPVKAQPARLAFGTAKGSISLRQIDLQRAEHSRAIEEVPLFAPTSRNNTSPGHFSHDGSKLVFVSNRGSMDAELWMANVDGSSPRQLTFFGSARGMLAGSWSPDGSRIVFDTALDGNHDIYVISAGGGRPVRLTTAPGLDGPGDWSADGQWIYYASEAKGGVWNIWRIPSDGGSPEQITTQGGFEPHVSPDGLHLYFLADPPLAGKGRLMRMPITGGEAEAILDDVSPFLWCTSTRGIYFLREEDRMQSINRYDFQSRHVVRIGVLPVRTAPILVPGRLTVSRDGRWALVNVEGPREGDLMLLDSFR